MKNSILLVAVLTTAVCGMLLVQKNREMAEIRRALAAADQDRADTAARAAQEGGQNRDGQERTHQKWLRAQKPAEAAENAASPPPPAITNASRVSKIFRDAAMKEAFRAEAKIAASRNVQKLFDSGLASYLNLNDQQNSALRQLLTQRASIFWDQMLVPMATGDVDPSSMASVGQGLKQAVTENDAQIRNLLGDDGYNGWQWFDKTQTERDEAADFAKAAATQGQPLTADQQASLLTLMANERANFTFQNDFGDPTKMDYENWYNNFTDDKLDAYQQDAESLNQKIAQDAQGLLTPDQARQLGQFLSQHLLQSMFTARSTQALFSQNSP